MAPDATALIVPLPEIDPLVSRWRARFDPSSALGVPPHVTLLYPFLSPDHMDAAAMRDIQAMCNDVAPFTTTFTRVEALPGLLYLAPEPADPYEALRDRLRARWPNVLPYEGRYGPRPAPHLTVAWVAPGQEAATGFDAIAAALTPHLPVTATAREVVLELRRLDRWSIWRRFRLDGP